MNARVPTGGLVSPRSNSGNRDRLPIDEVLDEVVEALRRHGAVVLRAPTGAGKTTRVPPAILDAGLAGNNQVVVLEPRRVAARAAARRVAEERGERLGGGVGYQIRFDRRAGPDTRLLFVTEGVLLRMLQADPFLEGAGALVFDEFHERRLDSDLALAMTRRVRREARDDLKLVVMSATLDPNEVAARLDGCPVVESTGRSYPVSTEYLERPDDRPTWILAEHGVRRIWARSTGDVLVFLPGVGEIRSARDRLQGFADEADAELATLYGDLPAERQDAVLRRSDRRRIVLSTNVAETSVTIAGVGAVVDTGFARLPRYDSGCGLDRLVLERISQASAEQRAGRAGRTGPGVCFRLWSRGQHAGLVARETPEVKRVDMAGPVLQLLSWGEPNPSEFDWYEAPNAASLERAVELLEVLGAIDGTGLTAVGREMAALPLPPRLARLLIESHRLGLTKRGARLAAMLSERAPFRRSSGQAWVSDSDVIDQLEALDDHNAGRPSRFELRSRSALRHIERAAGQLEREAKRLSGARPQTPESAREGLKRAVLVGYPDRVARRREGQESVVRGVMVGGRGVRLAESSAVRDSDLFVCVNLDAGRRGQHAEAIAREASAVEREWLLPAHLHEETTIRFDETSERVVAEAVVTYVDLALDKRRVSAMDPDAASRVLAVAAAERISVALPLARPDVAEFLVRLRCLADWRPDLQLPNLDESALAASLPDLCHGRTSFGDLQSLSLDELVAGDVTWEHRRLVDKLAPERLVVPTGSQIKLKYEEGRPPVLAVRIQEVFGWSQSPRIAGGQVAVLMHLLAPNMRPQQVTDDLASFWANTYPEVRKELRQRYPRHSWPVDPLDAKPVRK